MLRTVYKCQDVQHTISVNGVVNHHFLCLPPLFRFQTGRTFPQKLQVAPEDLSAGNLLEEVLVGEGAQVPPRDVDRPDLHLVDVELLHHPHGPVDDLVC